MVWKIGMGAERGTVENVRKKRETEKERKVVIE